jgi:flavin-dependent dehydrogenase
VAGAGPAGAVLARLLALRGRRVFLVDPGRRRTERLEVVSPSSLPVFAATGAAPLLDDPAIARPCLGIRRRWGTAGMQIDDFLRHPGGRGFTIDRSAFDAALRSMAKQAGVIDINGRLAGASASSGKITCQIETGARVQTISARIGVDATGRPAALARRMGARQILHERLIAALESREASANACAWLSVNDEIDHWSYSLDGPGGRRETWRVSRAAHRSAGSAWVNASATCLSPAAGATWIAVGDAACAFDPITSQGLFHAISTALIAAGIILSAEGLTAETGTFYAGAVDSTFAQSEYGRAQVYRALKHWNALGNPASHSSSRPTQGKPGVAAPRALGIPPAMA